MRSTAFQKKRKRCPREEGLMVMVVGTLDHR